MVMGGTTANILVSMLLDPICITLSEQWTERQADGTREKDAGNIIGVQTW